MDTLGLYLAVVAVTAFVAWWWRRRDGAAREVTDQFTGEQIAALGAPTGAPLLLEFTAPHCAPCRATRQVLDDVAALWPELVVHAADVGDALDVARAHHVLRAPTTFVLAPDGAVRGRIAGVPDPGDVGRLVEAALTGGPGGRGANGLGAGTALGGARHGARHGARGVGAEIQVEAPSTTRPRWALRGRPTRSTLKTSAR